MFLTKTFSVLFLVYHLQPSVVDVLETGELLSFTCLGKNTTTSDVRERNQGVLPMNPKIFWDSWNTQKRKECYFWGTDILSMSVHFPISVAANTQHQGSSK